MTGSAALPFGISQYSTLPQSFAEDLALYRTLGVPYIEVVEAKLDANNPHQELDELRKSELIVSSVQPRVHSLFPDLPRPEPKTPKERVARLRKTIELFGPLFPGTTLVTITGAAPNGDYARAYRTAATEYRELAKIAADQNVRLALEPLNPVLMNTDTFICSLPQGARIIDAVDHPSFGIFLDLWHFWEDPGSIEQIGKLRDRVFGVHISDWRTPRAFGDRYLPGDGEIPLVPLLKAIRETG
jgi:sugar phosphate isomerase/epimerase